MRIKMRDTTRHQHYNQLLAGHVYEVDDATGEHLLQQRIAARTTAPVTADQEAADAALDEEPAAQRPTMVTREGAAPLAGSIGGPTPDEPARGPDAAAPRRR